MPLKPTLLGAAAGLIIGLVVAELPPPGARNLPRARLVSDSGGALAEICIHYTKGFHEQCVELYTDLLKALAPGTVVYVAAAAQSEFDGFEASMRSAGALAAVQLRPVITGFAITPWAKDRFGTMRTDDGATLLAVPPAPTELKGPRGNDGRVPYVLASKLSRAEARPLPFFFEGGDLLADDDVAFVSANFLARNQPEDIDNRDALLRRLSTTLARRVFTVGDTSGDVPDHHIGMYLTPLGSGTVAVGDPDLGLSMLDREPGHDTMQRPDIQRDAQAYEPFRQVIARLEAGGFDVVRIPMLLTTTPRVFVTYNNAILEQRGDEKRIYMPVYDIPFLDAAATRAFEKQGWKVFPVRVDRVYQLTGSLRCLVGIVSRH